MCDPLLLEKGMLYGQVGKLLMFVESEIAQTVLLDMNRTGAVTLPIHDSFIVMRSYTDSLVESMAAAFQVQTGFQCAYKKDRTEHEERMVSLGVNTVYESSLEEFFRGHSREREECSIFWESYNRWARAQPWNQSSGQLDDYIGDEP